MNRLLLSLLLFLAPALTLAQPVPTGQIPHVNTRSALAALTISNFSTGDPVVLEEAGRAGIFHWNSANLSTKVTIDPSQCLTVAPASATSGASGAWERQNPSPVDPAWCGAVSDNAQTNAQPSLQAAINLFDNPSETGLPAAEGTAERNLFIGRVLDLKGRIYGVSQPLECNGDHGLKIINGTIIAIDDWTAVVSTIVAETEPSVIECNSVSDLVLNDLVIETNNKANGIQCNACLYGQLRNVRVSGFGLLQWGMKMITAAGGLGLHIDKSRFAGPEGHGVPATYNPTAIGLLVTGGSDNLLTDTTIIRIFENARISTGGWVITGNHFGGQGDQDPSPFVIQSNSQNNIFTSNYFDHGYLKVEGTTRLLVNSNIFFQTFTDMLDNSITFEATATGQLLGDITAIGNVVRLQGTPANFQFIKLVQPGSFTYTTMGLNRVFLNSVRQQSALPAAMYNTSATEGKIYVTMSSGNFTGASTKVSLASNILHPGATDGALQVQIECIRTSDNTVQRPTIWTYAANFLNMTFAAAFTGFCTLDFRWGHGNVTLNNAVP